MIHLKTKNSAIEELTKAYWYPVANVWCPTFCLRYSETCIIVNIYNLRLCLTDDPNKPLAIAFQTGAMITCFYLLIVNERKNSLQADLD